MSGRNKPKKSRLIACEDKDGKLTEDLEFIKSKIQEHHPLVRITDRTAIISCIKSVKHLFKTLGEDKINFNDLEKLFT